MDDLREVWRFRELLITFAVRDVKVRYKQTSVGIAWVVLQPVITALIFAFVFGQIARLGFPGNTPLLLGILAALTGFDLFKSTFMRSATSLVTNAQLVRKIYFPRVLAPLSTALSSLLDYCVAMVVFIIAYAGFALYSMQEGTDMIIRPPGVQLLLVPVCLLVFIMIAMGVGMAATALAASYRDIQHLIPVITQLAMYASPVMYDVGYVYENASRPMQILYFANPIAGLVSVYRYALIGAGTVSWGGFAWSCICAVLCFVIGALIFRRMERKVADVI